MVVIGASLSSSESLFPLRTGRADGDTSRPVAHLRPQEMFSELTSKFISCVTDARLQSVAKERFTSDEYQ
ncbi:hypothetical protein [Streptomyces sp. NBC_01483]|uniref:hypothetical protein n=1 Tax=Streptomyces sp. NBC_01483 TaxID=2903883 RepID=UPI002E32E9C5|nr:hypothetical protein [Streptomyces sp. NBC_01483]